MVTKDPHFVSVVAREAILGPDPKEAVAVLVEGEDGSVGRFGRVESFKTQTSSMALQIFDCEKGRCGPQRYNDPKQEQFAKQGLGLEIHVIDSSLLRRENGGCP